MLLVDDDDAGRDARAVEQVRRQPDDALDEPAPDKVAADVGLPVAAEQHAMRQDDRALARRLQGLDQVQQEGVVAVLRRRHTVLEAPELVVLWVQSVGPGLGREGRIGHRVVEGLEAAVRILEVRPRERVVAP